MSPYLKSLQGDCICWFEPSYEQKWMNEKINKNKSVSKYLYKINNELQFTCAIHFSKLWSLSDLIIVFIIWYQLCTLWCHRFFQHLLEQLILLLALWSYLWHVNISFSFVQKPDRNYLNYFNHLNLDFCLSLVFLSCFTIQFEFINLYSLW